MYGCDIFSANRIVRKAKQFNNNFMVSQLPFSLDVTRSLKCDLESEADPGFQVRGGALKKNRADRREARKFLGYFV